MGFPGGSDSKEYACNAEDLHSIPGSGRPSGEEKGNPSSRQRSLVGYSPWDCKEPDTTEYLTLSLSYLLNINIFLFIYLFCYIYIFS